jgi:hypothetical protein
MSPKEAIERMIKSTHNVNQIVTTEKEIVEKTKPLSQPVSANMRK